MFYYYAVGITILLYGGGRHLNKIQSIQYAKISAGRPGGAAVAQSDNKTVSVLLLPLPLYIYVCVCVCVRYMRRTTGKTSQGTPYYYNARVRSGLDEERPLSIVYDLFTSRRRPPIVPRSVLVLCAYTAYRQYACTALYLQRCTSEENFA